MHKHGIPLDLRHKSQEEEKWPSSRFYIFIDWAFNTEQHISLRPIVIEQEDTQSTE
jgi:hypothetical protein